MAVTLLLSYLEGARLTIRTNHEVLHWILTITKSTGKQAQWRSEQLRFKLYIVACAKKKHQAADALSRLSTKADDKTLLCDEVPPAIISQEGFACAPTAETVEF